MVVQGVVVAVVVWRVVGVGISVVVLGGQVHRK